jgi:hypothetical protein
LASSAPGRTNSPAIIVTIISRADGVDVRNVLSRFFFRVAGELYHDDHCRNHHHHQHVYHYQYNIPYQLQSPEVQSQPPCSSTSSPNDSTDLQPLSLDATVLSTSLAETEEAAAAVVRQIGPTAPLSPITLLDLVRGDTEALSFNDSSSNNWSLPRALVIT